MEQTDKDAGDELPFDHNRRAGETESVITGENEVFFIDRLFVCEKIFDLHTAFKSGGLWGRGIIFTETLPIFLDYYLSLGIYDETAQLDRCAETLQRGSQFLERYQLVNFLVAVCHGISLCIDARKEGEGPEGITHKDNNGRAT